MRIKTLAVAMLGTAVLVTVAAPAMAQATPATSGTSSGSDFTVAYSYMHQGQGIGSVPLGVDVTFSQPFTTTSSGALDLFGEFSVNHAGAGNIGQAFTTEFVTGGLRFVVDRPKGSFYGLGAVGFGHAGCGCGNGLVIDFGGGVLYPLNGKNFDFFAQVDIPIAMWDVTTTNLRLNIGIAIPVGKK